MPLTKPELNKVKRLLRQAYEAVQDAVAVHRSAGDGMAATRCMQIGRDILLEVDYLDDLLKRQP
jgi:hypothetical protein